MGYDISVAFKTKEEMKKMKYFLEANMPILDKLKESETFIHASNNVLEGNEMGYAPKRKNLLGFHGTGIPYYLWSVCSWMAVKSDMKDKKDQIYFYYDTEKMYVDINQEKSLNTSVNEDGIIKLKKLSPAKLIAKTFLGYGTDYKNQRKLLIELNNNWNHYNLEAKSKMKP